MDAVKFSDALYRALSTMIQDYSLEILMDERRFLGYFMDLYPKLFQEAELIKILHRHNLMAALIAGKDSPRLEQEKAFKDAQEILERKSTFSKDKVSLDLEAIVKAIGWERTGIEESRDIGYPADSTPQSQKTNKHSPKALFLWGSAAIITIIFSAVAFAGLMNKDPVNIATEPSNTSVNTENSSTSARPTTTPTAYNPSAGFERVSSRNQNWYSLQNDFYVSASSTLAPMGEFSYEVSNLWGSSANVAWVEGVEGDGIGEYLEFTFTGGSNETLKHIAVTNGYIKSDKAFNENGKVLEFIASVNGEYIGTLELSVSKRIQFFDTPQIEFARGDVLRLTISQVQKGILDDVWDTAITDISLYSDTSNGGS